MRVREREIETQRGRDRAGGREIERKKRTRKRERQREKERQREGEKEINVCARAGRGAAQIECRLGVARPQNIPRHTARGETPILGIPNTPKLYPSPQHKGV